MYERDELVEIPESRRRYFGGEGLMLLPGRATVEAALLAIPTGQTRTTAAIARKLALEAGARGTCPVTLRRVIASIAKLDSASAPWWRVTNADGTMFAFAPGGREDHARRLLGEGVALIGEGVGMRADNPANS